jgi:hypothetical protein
MVRTPARLEQRTVGVSLRMCSLGCDGPLAAVWNFKCLLIYMRRANMLLRYVETRLHGVTTHKTRWTCFQARHRDHVQFSSGGGNQRREMQWADSREMPRNECTAHPDFRWHLPSNCIACFPVKPQSQSQSHITTDGQSFSMSWCRDQSGTFDQRFFFLSKLLSCPCGAPSLTRGRGLYFVSPLSMESIAVSQYLHR